MKNCLLIIAAALAAILAGCSSGGTLLTPSGEYVDASTLDPQQRKQLTAMQDSLLHAQALAAINARDFVLEADQLMFKRGQTASVSSLTNFVALDGDNASVQVAPFIAGGPNGVGGITLDGRPSNIRFTEDKNGAATLTMTVIGSVISASVTLRLYPGSNRGEVLVESNFRAQRITLRGRIFPTESSNVYKGNSI